MDLVRQLDVEVLACQIIIMVAKSFVSCGVKIRGMVDLESETISFVFRQGKI